MGFSGGLGASMMETGPVGLSSVQHVRLEALAREDEGVRVIGWDALRLGPVLSFSDGKRRVLNAMGRLVPERHG